MRPDIPSGLLAIGATVPFYSFVASWSCVQDVYTRTSGPKDVSHNGTKTGQPRERTIPELRVGFHVCECLNTLSTTLDHVLKAIGSFSITRVTYDVETSVKTP